MIFGIDPGKSGAIAAIAFCWNETISLNNTEHDISEWLDDHVQKNRDDCFAYLERVSAMPKQGVSSTFKFGQSFGFVRGLLVAHRVPFEMVDAGKWQREFGLRFPKKLGLSKTQKKNRHKAKAQELWPKLKITHANADALLLAEYGRRKRNTEFAA